MNGGAVGKGDGEHRDGERQEESERERERATRRERGINTDDDREQRRAGAVALSSLEPPCSAWRVLERLNGRAVVCFAAEIFATGCAKRSHNIYIALNAFTVSRGLTIIVTDLFSRSPG